MSHWTAKAYLRGRVVSQGLNCFIGTRNEAKTTAERYFSKAEDTANPVFDRITLQREETGTRHACICMPWPPA